MQVSVDGVPQYNWVVSTGRKGHRTPVGDFRPTRMAAVYFSKKYDNSPMPHAMFFLGGFAIHGTEYCALARQARLAWLRTTASDQCGPALFAGERVRASTHRDPHPG